MILRPVIVIGLVAQQIIFIFISRSLQVLVDWLQLQYNLESFTDYICPLHIARNSVQCGLLRLQDALYSGIVKMI